MSDTRNYIQRLFTDRQINIPQQRLQLFNEFITDAANCDAVNQIIDTQKQLMDKWKIKNRIADIIDQRINIPNGTVDKAYEATIDWSKNGWEDIIYHEIDGFEAMGLQYNSTTNLLSGIPILSGDHPITFKFRLQGEEDNSSLHEKKLLLIINPNPKTLWKNNDSDKNDPYWKEDNVATLGLLGNKRIVVASRRGRSHANAGSFRDDDFAFTYLPETGWGVVAVADGAGSAKLSREGSRIACEAVINFFMKNMTTEANAEFDSLIAAYAQEMNEENQKRLSSFTYTQLSKTAYYAHQQIAQAASDGKAELKDFHTTLIFTLFKNFAAGYALLSFGIGDCPMAVINNEQTEVTLMNWLDVGEFGGGTRFITMPEIFKSEKFSTRFKFKLIEDFSFLFLMTDGIYDAKFVVEGNLEKIEKWKEFLLDLQGNNDEHHSVELKKDNDKLPDQLAAWMDFWSAGNHDDRTLAIIF